MRARSASDLIAQHEGWRLKPYTDTLGVITIGYGRNLERGITRDEAEILMRNDLRTVRTAAARYEWFEALSDVRQAVVLDMQYQLGVAGFRKFKRTRAAIAAHAWATAAEEMLNSRWHEQTPTRAKRLAKMMREDRWPDV